MATDSVKPRTAGASHVLVGLAALSLAAPVSRAAAAPSPPVLLPTAAGGFESIRIVDAIHRKESTLVIDHAGSTLVIARRVWLRGTTADYPNADDSLETLEVWDVGAKAPRLRVVLPGAPIALCV